jgi:uncharacterized protein
MRRRPSAPPARVAGLLVALALVPLARAADEPVLPARPAGFVTDQAHVLSPAARTGLEALLEELRAKTGAEIAVVTVETTAPLDDFDYAMRVAETWKPGRKGEDTGVVFLVAVRDRRVRILIGYGLEGILPDGLVGEIQDRAVVPAFRAGRYEAGIVAGVRELAARIAADRGVTLTGVPPPAPGPQAIPLPAWAVVLILLVLVLYALGRRPRSRRRVGAIPWWGGGFGGGGFGGGGGGFGGFGGGSFGGGGAGRGW